MPLYKVSLADRKTNKLVSCSTLEDLMNKCKSKFGIISSEIVSVSFVNMSLLKNLSIFIKHEMLMK